MQIITIGMHRSGTSTLARILNLLGAYYGTEDVATTTAPDNPKGFWERKDVMAANDFILDAAGGNWWDIENFNINKISKEDRVLIDTEVRDILFKLDSHRPWFIKDPRFCLTLPLWQSHLEKPVYVLALRSPLSVAKSLQKRNNIPIVYGLALWEYYMRVMSDNIYGANYIPIQYENILNHPYETGAELYKQLSAIGDGELQAPKPGDIEAFVESKLCHHEEKNEDLELADELRALFEDLCSGRPVSSDQFRLQSLLQQMRRMKEKGTWTANTPAVESLSKIRDRLAQFESKVEMLEGNNLQLKLQVNELTQKNEELLNKNNYFEKDNLRLAQEVDLLREVETRLNEEKSLLNRNLKEANDNHTTLLAKHEELSSRHDQFHNRLNAISHSRLVRTTAFTTRFLGLGQFGINAELNRIDQLLIPPSDQKLIRRKLQKSDLELVVRVLQLFLKHPAQALSLMDRERIRRTLEFLFLRKGNLLLFANRCEEVHFRFPDQIKCKIDDPAIELLDIYGLPRSSHANRPSLPNDSEIIRWGRSLKNAAETVKKCQQPEVSIIIPVYNQIRYTLACIHSIYLNVHDIDYEIIIADDGSTDSTDTIFSTAFPNVRYQRNKKNLGFLRNCNKAAEISQGEYIVFLNNDTIVLEGWLNKLLDTFKLDTKIGLVGSKLIYPEGRLQEAGGIVFEDGSGWNYGRFEDPSNPKYDYMRNVDYCSGASIMIPKGLWRSLGGFDHRYTPAYYEDTDFSFQVRGAKRRVVYQPKSQLIHFEGISSGREEEKGVKRYQAVNRYKFANKWRDQLRSYGVCNPDSLPFLRNPKGRILYIDATTPTPDKDSGSIDTVNYMKIFKELGYHITYVTLDLTAFKKYTSDLQKIGVECIHLPWIKSVEDAINIHGPLSDLIVLSRLQVAGMYMDFVKQHAIQAKIIYDTVDLHFLREMREASLYGSSRMESIAANTRKEELDTIEKADATMLRSEYEMQMIRDLLPNARTYKIPVVRDLPDPIESPWEKLKDVVFIGGYNHPPNVDAVKYFVSDVWPRLKKRNFPGKFIIAGSDMPSEIKSLASTDIVVRGYVPNLRDLFEACRLSVAPLRYGAGMKGKVVTSLSYGIPCVATEIAVEGTALRHDENILVALNAEDMADKIQSLYSDQDRWQALSKEGLKFCAHEISMESVKARLKQMIAEISED